MKCLTGGTPIIVTALTNLNETCTTIQLDRFIALADFKVKSNRARTNGIGNDRT